MYEVVVLNSAAKQLRNLDKPIKNRIIETLIFLCIGKGVKMQVNYKALIKCC